jgi:DNA-binding NarL/FixJ family response regulator
MSVDERTVPPPVRVVIVGRDPLARAALVAALAAQPGVTVVGHVDAAEAAAGAGESPDLSGASVMLWDMGPASRAVEPPVSGDVPVLALATDQEQAERAVAAGAAGVIERDVDGDRIAAAARAVDQRLHVVGEAFAPAILGRAARPGRRERARAPLGDLTPREQEVLRMLAEGLSNRQLARRLGISEHTAKFHVNSILEKLDSTTRTEAVVQAARLGLLRL